ncbi:tudor and KH domain-containing protein homolog [Odontomachus brunneus]|uniref:tudor and KH domain-containing protein homolog n=1 Tax=Odontomachus brunneus TaxID=486640 RepID=UPI0013F23898|nr:tudor and KH domain-containing protein homolog [Odontomachus brunneus]XP_032671095.1 tudor and KH domain-containing protein homolog [Odontomachus brunneus]XP_032671096.1 tudor and KH domain-containing protein homolog [Odontomachus brunneus]
MMWILQNIRKESILFGLLGVSLTTVGITLLYEFYLRKEDDKCKSICQVEFKVPNSNVAFIIGKQGCTIRDIEKKSGATINLRRRINNKNNKKCDSTDKICLISGSAEGVKLAQVMIQNIIDNIPVIDTYEFYVPYKAVKHILGKGRQNLQKIQEISHAKVMIDDSDLDYKSPDHPANYSYGDPSKDGKKRIVVHGTVRQIEVALDLIEQKVQQEDGVDAVLQELCPIKVSGAHTKLLTDEIRNGPTFSKITLSPLPPDDTMEVYVSAMETPGQFWVQILGPGIIYLESLVSQMSLYYDDENNRPMHIMKEITVGDIVAARCIQFDQWYRGEITRILPNSQYEVFLLDYGTFLECTRKDILELRTDMLSLRLQAVECKLANVKPIKTKWDSDACKEFIACTWLGQSKVMDATITGYIKRPSHHRRPPKSDAVVLCVELFDRHQNIKIDQHLISLALAELDEVHPGTMHLETNPIKRQFLSIQLPNKTVCLTAHAEEGEMNEDKSAPFSSIYNSTTPTSKKSNQPVNTTDSITLAKEYNDIVPERRSQATTLTLDTNKDDAKRESEPDDVTMKKGHGDIVPERKNEAEISTSGANKNDIKDSKPDNVTTSVKKHSDVVPLRKNEAAEISTSDASKNDAKPESESDDVTPLEEEHSGIVPKNGAEITSDANKDDIKPESKPNEVTVSVKEHINVALERKNEANISMLDAKKDDINLELEYLPVDNIVATQVNLR